MEIKFEKVNYTYNDNRTPALEDINIHFQKGKISAIIGSSGSGKTTLAQLTNALLLPTNGQIKVGRFTLVKDKKIKTINNLRKNVGLVFQFPEDQFFHNTVKEEISFGMKCFEYKLDHLEKRVKDALIMVGLDETYLNQNPLTLSNGEKRKVALASILAFNPKVLILDEPTIGLDSKSQKSLIKLLKMLKNRYNKTIIVISHDLDMLLKLVDYVYVLKDGKLALEGDKFEVFSKEEELNACGLETPKIITFENLVKKKKGIRIGYRDEINDLIKDIYRNAK